MSFKSTVMSGLGWVAGSNFLGQIITWGITIVVMRVLSPADYGLLAMASVFVAFLALMSSAGLGPAIVQAASIDDRRLRQLLGLILALNALLFLALFLAAPFIAGFFNEARLTDIIRVLAAQFIISSFTVIPESLLGRQLRFKSRALVDLASNVLGGVVTLSLALSGAGVWSLIAGAMVVVTAKAIGLNILSPYLHWPQFSFSGTSALLGFGGKVTAARLLWFFYSQADMFIAGKLLGKDALGAYSVAMHLASLPVQKISAVINQVAFPAFAKIQHDKALVAAHFLKAATILSFFAFPVLWGLSSVAPEVVHLILGSKWEQAIFPLQMLPAIMPLRMVSGFVYSALDAFGRPDIGVRNLIAACVVMPIAFIIGSRWGVEGLCTAWLVCYPVLVYANLHRAMPVIGLTAVRLMQTMARPALASVAMYGTITLARTYLLADVSSALRLAAFIVIGAIVYGGLAFTTNRKSVDLVIAAFRRKEALAA